MTEAGIYITNAVKRPKRESAVPQEMIEESLPVLERELSLFPNLRAVMLMGDVAKKAFNMIARSKDGEERHSRRLHLQAPQDALSCHGAPHFPVLHHDGAQSSD